MSDAAQRGFDLKHWKAVARNLEVQLQFPNPIAEFASEVQRAASVGQMKISLEQRGQEYTETDEYIEFGGYRMYKKVT